MMKLGHQDQLTCQYQVDKDIVSVFGKEIFKKSVLNRGIAFSLNIEVAMSRGS